MVFEDRVAKYPGRWTMVKSNGTSEIVTLIRNDEPTKKGTPINAATLNELSTVAGAINAKEEAVSAAQAAASERTKAEQAAANAANAVKVDLKKYSDKAATSASNAAESEKNAKLFANAAQEHQTGAEAAQKKAEDAADRAAAIVSTDKTLSVEGAPADGKAVGDALKGVISADAVKTLITDALAEDHAKIKFWVSEDPTSPAALFGGSWEEIASERVLMGASSTHAAGTTVEAGLPNITGDSWLRPNNNTITENGPFYLTDLEKRNPPVGNFNGDSKTPSATVGFDASKSNAVYGRSSTVQPAAYYVHIWRRVA